MRAYHYQQTQKVAFTMTNSIVLRDYQQQIVDKEQPNSQGCCLFMDMGAGKTLTAISLIKKFKSKRVLIISLAKVVNTVWGAELTKWGCDINYIPFANKGGEQTTQKIRSLRNSTGFAIGINYEVLSTTTKYKLNKKGNETKVIDTLNSPLLYELIQSEWDVIIIDESSKIKDPDSKVSKAVLNLSINTDAYILCLTGTPSPETTLNLYTQVSVVDRGKRLGESYHGFRKKYFYKDAHGFKYLPFPDSQEKILGLISDVCYVVTTKDAKLDLPPLLEMYVEFDLTADEKKCYNQVKERVLQKDGLLSTSKNAGVVVSKLLQATSGFVYADTITDNQTDVINIGSTKIDKLLELINQIRGKVIVNYWFNHTLNRLETVFKERGITYTFDNKTSPSEFKSSNYKVLLLQPSSGAYGSNYQECSNNMIILEIDFSGERYQQVIKRLHRQGQKKTVFLYYLVAKGTYDKKALQRVKDKDLDSKEVLKEIKDLQNL